MITRHAVIAEAKSWLGTPFIHQASLKGIGTDCKGLIEGVADILRLPDVDRFKADLRFKNYGRQPLAEWIITACTEYLDEIAIEHALLGDILVFAFYKKIPMHFAFVSANDPRYMLHAYEPVGRVVENRIDEKWARRIVNAYGLRGVG